MRRGRGLDAWERWRGAPRYRGGTNWFGRISILELAVMMERAALWVGNDRGQCIWERRRGAPRCRSGKRQNWGNGVSEEKITATSGA